MAGQSGANQQPPVRTFRDGGLAVAIWEEACVDDESGRSYMKHSFKLSKSFPSTKTQSGYDERSMSLFSDDMLKAAQLLTQAYQFAQVKSQGPQQRRPVR